MQNSRILQLLGIAALALVTEAVQAADEDAFLQQVRPPSEQTMGYGRSAIWTLPLVATQYQPSQPTPAMQAAMQAQREGRFLDALIPLDEARKSGKLGPDAEAELNLLRASFLLQGNQSRQALESLAPLLNKSQYAADAYALTAMAHLQQGKMQEALDAAQHAQGSGGGVLPHLALSYALQGAGRLAEAREVMHRFNGGTSPSAIALAREAELALTLDQISAARSLVGQAQQADAAQPYVVAVSGLVYLIDGHPRQAKAAFETALQRDPKDAKALLGLGLAEIKLGNYQAGQDKLQAANEADPGNALILTYLGRSQHQLGQTEAARASWRAAQQADPKDPIPWLYQAQAELQANHPMQARESLREAQARLDYRSVYRGERLLKEDDQLLRANLAEVQRQLGSEELAFHTLADSPGEKNSASLRNEADLLQGQRFGESARRSLLLQSQFNAKPGALPSDLDIYGDGAGQTGSTTPQHGAVSGLGAQQASYNNYDELFSRNTMLEADATKGSQKTSGEQVRLGAGSDTLGVGLAQRHFLTAGNGPFENLDNRLWQGIAQWQPVKSTELFVSRQSFNSQHGETFQPAFPFGFNGNIKDNSHVTRLGLRHSLTDDDELRGLWSSQRTNQASNFQDFSVPPIPSSNSATSGAHSAELQYRHSGASYATQWGVQKSTSNAIYRDATGVAITNDTFITQQSYAALQQTLNRYLQLDAGLGWGKINHQDRMFTSSTYVTRWLPRLGAVITPDAVTHVRLAAWRGMGVSGVGDATLAPVSLAGIVLSRPDDANKLVHATALGADRQLGSAWLLDVQIQRRMTDLPFIGPNGGQILTWQQVDESRLALHWQPHENPWAVSLAYDDERIQNDPLNFALDSVDKQRLRSLQLAVRWFASEQWTVSGTWSHNRVFGTQQSLDLTTFNTIFPAYWSGFNQLDADLSWKFNRNGALTAGVRNAADKRFQYTEIDKLNPRFSKGRLAYANLKLDW